MPSIDGYISIPNEFANIVPNVGLKQSVSPAFPTGNCMWRHLELALQEEYMLTPGGKAKNVVYPRALQ
ncbi:hypothetical protein ACOMHN_046042 [Nucella lapillus]